MCQMLMLPLVTFIYVDFRVGDADNQVAERTRESAENTTQIPDLKPSAYIQMICQLESNMKTIYISPQ